MFVICYIDRTGYEMYFSRFGLWQMKEWVGKCRIENAMKFESKAEAKHFINQFLDKNREYKVVEFKE